MNTWVFFKKSNLELYILHVSEISNNTKKIFKLKLDFFCWLKMILNNIFYI